MKLFYTFLLLSFPSILFAQTNYQKGYVLKTTGDTVKGYINYREWLQSPMSIDFKINKEDKQVMHFTPQNIKAFEITGMENYVSYTGLISMDKTLLPDLPASLDTTRKQNSIFLKEIATGSHITLFYQNDKIKARFFIAEKGDNPVELKYYQYYTNSTETLEMTIYRGQLSSYINKFNINNPELLKQTARARYVQTDLEDLVNTINDKKDVVKAKKSSNRFFVGAGVNNTQTRFHSVNFPTNYNSAVITPKIDFGVDVFLNPNVQQFILRLDLSFSYINPRFILPSVYTNTYYTYSFKQYTTTATPQVLFNFYNKDKFKIYADAGIAFNLSAYSKTKISNPGEQIFDLEPYWANFPLQVGAALNKKMEFSFTYTGIAPYTQYVHTSISNRSAYLGFKYFLGKH